MDAPVPDSRPLRESFFKLILLYPTLAIAAIGAIPQYIQVFKAMTWDVPVNSVNSAEREHNLWVKNVDCGVGEDGRGIVSLGSPRRGEVQRQQTGSAHRDLHGSCTGSHPYARPLGAGLPTLAGPGEGHPGTPRP